MPDSTARAAGSAMSSVMAKEPSRMAGARSTRPHPSVNAAMIVGMIRPVLAWPGLR